MRTSWNIGISRYRRLIDCGCSIGQIYCKGPPHSALSDLRRVVAAVVTEVFFYAFLYSNLGKSRIQCDGARPYSIVRIVDSTVSAIGLNALVASQYMRD